MNLTTSMNIIVYSCLLLIVSHLAVCIPFTKYEDFSDWEKENMWNELDKREFARRMPSPDDLDSLLGPILINLRKKALTAGDVLQELNRLQESRDPNKKGVIKTQRFGVSKRSQR